jgi:hypothetical protein
MRRILLLLTAAMLVTVMMAFMAGPAFAACADIGPVTANDQARGCFGTAQGTANDKSNRNADKGLATAYMNNTEP